LALSRTLGFTGRQLHATVGWQASVIALAALLIGTPLGLALGLAIWRRFADGLHCATAAATPWAWLLVVALVTLEVANAVAALPGQSATRATPAVTLRSE
jgi:predicted lysophospholipase L1 biosynthesis ABC-type transport system permease subunit